LADRRCPVLAPPSSPKTRKTDFGQKPSASEAHRC